MIMIPRKRPLPRRFLLAAALAAGFGTLWFALVIWLGTAILQARPGKFRRRAEALVVAADGTPLVRSVSHDNLSLMTFRDLDGRPRDDVDTSDQIPGVALNGEHENVPSRAQSNWSRRIRVFMDEREPAAVWYFVHDGKPEGSGEFVGYERGSNRLIGHVGLAGVRAQPVPPGERIPVHRALAVDFSAWSSAPLWIYSGSQWALRPDPWDVPPRLVHVPSGNRLRVVDLAARTARTVLETPAPIVSVGVPVLSSYSGDKTRKERRPILVRAGQTVYKLDHKYDVVGTFAVPAEIGRSGAVTWYEADDGRAIVVGMRPPKIGELLRDQVSRQTVYRVAGDGTIQASSELALRLGPGLVGQEEGLHLLALGLPAPAALLAGEFLMAAEDPRLDYRAALGESLKRSWPTLLALLALSCVLAAAAWRRARAFGLSRREQAAWAAFVLLFGVPAHAGFLLHRRWPVRETCPHCHARVARDRETCAECGTPFPAPALKGTEIFA